MPHRVRAKVKKELLTWARQSSGLSVEQIARKAGSSEKTVNEWEAGKKAPTIGQLQKLADIYRRPLAVFYLPEPPLGFAPMRDFRRMPGEGMRSFSPELSLEMRFAQERRNLAIELAAEADEKLPHFPLRASTDEDAETVGKRVREALSISDTDRAAWSRDGGPGYATFNSLRSKIEGIGALVFQASRVSADEVSGFAIAEEPFPTIVVARKDTSPRRRSFSLMHELAHIAIRVGGVSDGDVDARRPPEDSFIEVWCNRVAAASLMPSELFLAREAIKAGRSDAPRWQEDTIAEVARWFGVSREAVVRRMLTLGLTTQSFYEAKRKEYQKGYAEERERKRVEFAAANQKFARNPAQDAVSDLGAPLVRLILESYYQERMSLSDVSGYFRVRTKHVPSIEDMTRGWGR